MIGSYGDRLLIDNIEQALRIKLYDNQVKYILGEIDGPEYDSERGTGKTTAYCIKLALSSGDPLDFKHPEKFSDAYSSWSINKQVRYSRDSFLPKFLRIREKLLIHGFKVRDGNCPKRQTGGFIVGD